jgi:signal transduction histidine kinase
VPVELATGERWLSISGVSLPGGTVYAFRDFTEERRVERLKSEFVSTISHELRTPLAAIFGSGKTLSRDDLTLSDDRRTALLDVIVDESNRLARIVEDVLLASRLDAGVLQVAIETCDSAEIVNSLAVSRRIHAPPNIEIVVTPHPPVRVTADANRLLQVLRNLVDNAIKYSPNGGQVEIAVQQADGRVQFRIIDEGIGIPPGERERIFEKFYRLDPELTRGVGGTGLGLYICRQLVHHMDGQIWIEAADGKGSVFVVELPRAQ